jgi:hypothetical protein
MLHNVNFCYDFMGKLLIPPAKISSEGKKVAKASGAEMKLSWTLRIPHLSTPTHTHNFYDALIFLYIICEQIYLKDVKKLEESV